MAPIGDDRSPRGTDTAPNLSISETQLQLISTMSKYSVLVSICLFATFINFSIIFTRIMRPVFGGPMKLSVTLKYIHFNFLMFDIFLNIIGFMVQFRFFGNKKYLKYCKYCDNKCKSIVKRKTIDEMAKVSNIKTFLQSSIKIHSDSNHDIPNNQNYVTNA